MPGGDHENHPPRTRRPGYYESQIPSDADFTNPVYAQMEVAHDLYQGLVVTETGKVEDTYREWLRSGKKPQPLLGECVTRDKTVGVSIGQMSEWDIDRSFQQPGRNFADEETLMNQDVLDRLERIEDKADRILVQLGEPAAVTEVVDQFLSSVGECGVQPFVETVTEHTL